MDSFKPPRRKLTAAQKKAGIKLVKGWKKPEAPDPAGLYGCFASPARIKRKKVMIGVVESREVHRKAIWRGMTTKRGELKPNLSWQEKLVMTLRTVTTAQDFNHEWWGAYTLEPVWFKKTEEIYRDSWLYFPSSPKDLAPRSFGKKLGHYLTLSESKLELAATNKAYLAKVEDVELEKAQRGFEEDEKRKVKVVIAGYDDMKQAMDESYKHSLQLRAAVVSLVAAEASRVDFGEFFEGFAAGRKKAAGVDLNNQLSDYNRTEEVIDILLEDWLTIDQLENRTEISRYIRSHLPEKKKKPLEDEEETPWLSFVVWLRDIYDKIGLRPSGKGAPKKNREKEKE